MRIRLDHPSCKPEKRYHSDAGYDLKNGNGTEVIIAPYESKIIHTGVYVEIPEGYVGLVFPRSSLGKKGLILENTVGVIDSHYRGEIMVLAKNVKTESRIKIGKYSRFAQLVLVPVLLPVLEVVDKLNETERGTGGFGSTDL